MDAAAITYPVDIRVVSSVDVSREHARIDAIQTGQFFLIDLSSLGTTLNGRHVPRGYDELDGTKENARDPASGSVAHRSCGYGVSAVRLVR